MARPSRHRRQSGMQHSRDSGDSGIRTFPPIRWKYGLVEANASGQWPSQSPASVRDARGFNSSPSRRSVRATVDDCVRLVPGAIVGSLSELEQLARAVHGKRAAPLRQTINGKHSVEGYSITVNLVVTCTGVGIADEVFQLACSRLHVCTKCVTMPLRQLIDPYATTDDLEEELDEEVEAALRALPMPRLRLRA